jgi:hypothetical protein
LPSVEFTYAIPFTTAGEESMKPPVGAVHTVAQNRGSPEQFVARPAPASNTYRVALDTAYTRPLATAGAVKIEEKTSVAPAHFSCRLATFPMPIVDSVGSNPVRAGPYRNIVQSQPDRTNTDAMMTQSQRTSRRREVLTIVDLHRCTVPGVTSYRSSRPGARGARRHPRGDGYVASNPS